MEMGDVMRLAARAEEIAVRRWGLEAQRQKLCEEAGELVAASARTLLWQSGTRNEAEGAWLEHKLLGEAADTLLTILGSLDYERFRDALRLATIRFLERLAEMGEDDARALLDEARRMGGVR